MRYDFVIVGSGVGGATIARELSAKDRKVLVVEKGRYHRLGSEWEALKYYSKPLASLLPMEKSKGGVEMFRTLMVGGSSVVTLGNGVRPSEDALKGFGFSLDEELREAERDLNVSPYPEDMMGERTKRLKSAAEELGYEVKPMPKFIDFSKCRGCGMCVTGCRYGAKWSSQMFLADFLRHRGKMVVNTSVDRVIHSSGEVKGILVHGPRGAYEIEAENVILAAGGIGTPIILQRSGLSSAGGNLFADLFVNTYGLVDDRMDEEAGMATVIDEFHSSHGFMLSPIMDTPLHMFLYLPMFRKTRVLRRNRLLGIITKISDDSSGRVDADGTINKDVTKNDRAKLERGVKISKDILLEAGVKSSSMFTTGVRGAHPGGTAGVGRVVNPELETEISRLFVSDASIIPEALGLPPVLTIVAFSKKLAHRITSEYLS